MIEKEDNYLQIFMGTSYTIGNPKTLGQLKKALEEIAADLPSDLELGLAEVELRDGKLTYILTEGIPQ